jgi:flagellar biogenesis protein FliO
MNRLRFCIILVVTIVFSTIAIAQSTEAPSGSLKDLPSFGDQLIRTCVILLGLLIVLVLVLRYLPRLGRRRGRTRSDLIKVIQVQALDASNRVYLLRVAGSYILVGSSREGLRTLAGGELNKDVIDAALAGNSAIDESRFQELMHFDPAATSTEEPDAAASHTGARS